MQVPSAQLSDVTNLATSTCQQTPPPIKKHLPVLDGIRGLAALMVMAFHYLEGKNYLIRGTFYEPLLKFSALGQTGVDLFFVLSGFLITRILINSKNKQNFFSIFYARRSIRIMPLYYFYLVLALIVLPILAGEALPEFSKSWYSWVHLQNIPRTFQFPSEGPLFYWSLAVEEHFYLFWPVLVYFLPRRKIAIASLLLIAFSFGLRLYMLPQGWDVFYFTLTRMDALLFGALLAVFEPALLTRTANNRRLFTLLFFSVGVPLGLIFLAAGGTGNYWVLAVKYPMTALVYTALIGFAITTTDCSWVRKVFESRPLCFIGSISYGLYVYHTLCFKWLNQLLPETDPLLPMPLAFACAIAVAYVSFHLLEKPFLRLKRFFEYSKNDTSLNHPQPLKAT
ncbi:MAG: acyltransferase [Cyanobacteria bacterium J06614_10]